MIKRMLLNDLKRNKTIALTLFFFILLAALLMSCAAGTTVYLAQSLDHFFAKADPPDFFQMHAGDIDVAVLDRFAVQSGMVEKQQLVTLLNIDSAHLIINPNGEAEHGSVMDNSFVTQNPAFDYLLNLDNEIIRMQPGQVGVPVYYMQKYGLQLGDTLTIADGETSRTFIIGDFVRDSQMNPAMISSKRFLLHADDWNSLAAEVGSFEYLIEYKLYDRADANRFETFYQSAGMPQNGPSLTYAILKTMNALSDGILIVLVVLVSFLLTGIAFICLRFTILSSMEEDLREIGVMKALGLSKKSVSELYKQKYRLLIAAACLCGYIASLFLTGFFTGNLALYMGRAPRGLTHFALPVVAAVIVYLTATGFCGTILRALAKISPVEALRTGRSAGNKQPKHRLKLHRTKHCNPNVFLGVKSVLDGWGKYGLLCVIFAICVFLFIVPYNVVSTMKAPDFVGYMGIVDSDIRIDLRQGFGEVIGYTDVLDVLESDTDVRRFAAYVTTRCKAQNGEGEAENLQVESGDFDVFTLPYSDGRAPRRENEIALSDLAASTLEKQVGDTLILLENDSQHELVVCGIYQDITNGGKTAKSVKTFSPENVLWQVISVDFADGVHVEGKITQYTALFEGARVLGVQDYGRQTFGSMLVQLQKFTVLLAVIALGVAVLITALFLKMLLSKEASQIAIQRSIGITERGIQIQYLTQVWLVLLVGFALGIGASVTLGQSAIGLLMGGMGASNIVLLINPVVTLLLVPLFMGLAVGTVAVISCKHVAKSNSVIVPAE